MRQVKILAFVPSLFRLGPAADLLDASRDFSRHGIDLQFVTLGDEQVRGRLKTDLQGVGSRLQQPVEPISSERIETPVHYLGRARMGWLAARELWSVTKEVRPDLVHNWHGPAWVDRVWNLMGHRRILTLGSSCAVQQRLQTVKRAPCKIVLADTGFGETIPRYSPEFACQNRKVPVSLYPLGIPVPDRESVPRETGLRSGLGLAEDTKMAVAVSPLEPWARLKDLIWATDLLCCIRDDFHLVIVGNGKQRGQLERFSRLTEAASHIHLVGETVDPVSLIRQADVYWQASPQGSARGAIRIAMGSGVPVVACVGEGNESLVLHQRTGLRVPPGSREGFARWTKFLLEQIPLRDRLVRQASEHLSRFSASGSVAEFLAAMYLDCQMQAND